MDWWEEEPLRIFEIGDAFVDLGTRDALRTAEDADKVGANAQHLFCMMQAGGLDDRKLFFDTSIAKTVNRDLRR